MAVLLRLETSSYRINEYGCLDQNAHGFQKHIVVGRHTVTASGRLSARFKA